MRSIRSSAVGTTLVSYDFLLGCLLALLVATATVISQQLRDQAVAALLVASAVAVGLLGIVLAALAILVTFMGEEYLIVLDHVPGGFRGAMLPYKVVGAVSTTTALAGLIVALLWSSLPRAGQSIGLGLVALGVVWAAVGTFQLLLVTADHGEQRATLLGHIRQRRMRDRQGESASTERAESASRTSARTGH